jgi:ABC-type multidrug transport system fused ATPase/permease subunit
MAKSRRGRPSQIDDDMPKAKLSAANFKQALRLFEFMKEVKWQFWLGMFFLIGTASVGLYFPLLGGSLIGNISNTAVSGADKLASINRAAIPLFIVLAIQGLFSFGRVVMFTKVSEHILKALRDKVFGSVIKKPMEFFNKHQTAELSARLATDVSAVGEAFTLVVAEIIRQSVVGIGGLILMIYYTKPQIAFWFLVVIIPIIIISLLFAKKIRAFSKQYQDKIAEASVVVGDSLMGIVNVKTFTNEQYEMERYGAKTSAIKSFGEKYGIFRGSFFAFVIMCVFGAIFFILYKMLLLHANMQLSGEEFGRFLMLALFVSGSLGGLPEAISGLQRALGATDRLFDIMDTPTEDLNLHNSNLVKDGGSLSLINLNFNYPSRTDYTVLNNVSFTVEKGTTVALVGGSGSGKSTLANLILRFYDVQSGDILFNKQSIYSLDLYTLRQRIAYVPQDVLLFAGTIKENIAYGKINASEEEILLAAKQANAFDFINSFPAGLDTLVGERGVQLSGGQRQRIAIARAVLKNPEILILDEATSSLDSESEKLVQDALDKLMQGRTSLVIAHRLATIRNADKIVVLDKGHVVEQGSHDELHNLPNGIYAKLSKLQTFSVE